MCKVRSKSTMHKDPGQCVHPAKNKQRKKLDLPLGFHWLWARCFFWMKIWVLCSNILLLILFFSFNENLHSFHFYLKQLNNEDWHFREYKGEMVIYKSRLRTSGSNTENGERPQRMETEECKNVVFTSSKMFFFYLDPPFQIISDPDPDPVSYPALYKLL